MSETVIHSKKNRLGLYFIIILLILLGLGFSSYYLYNHKINPVIFSINNKTYRKNDIRKYTIFPNQTLHQTTDDTYKQIFNELKTIEAGKLAGLDFSANGLNLEKKSLNILYANNTNAAGLNDWIDLNSQYKEVIALTDTKLSSQIDGYSFVFWYGSHLEEGLGGDKSGINPTLAAADKTYCLDRANYYYNAIKAGTISLDVALSEIQADPKLGFGNPSVHFINNPKIPILQSQVAYSAIAKTIATQDIKGLSPLIKGYTNTTFKPSPNSLQNTYVYFIYLKAYNDSISKYSKQLFQLKANYVGIK
jgi:hypothetical protein